jgi:(E)-4-hydroxy-3-methylbut-2-enyl-diphosphate synthase
LIPVERRQTVAVDIDGVVIGGDAPIVVQSMTNTDTADVASTFDQVMLLADAGSQLVRVTVNNDAAAQALPEIVSRLKPAE